MLRLCCRLAEPHLSQRAAWSFSKPHHFSDCLIDRAGARGIALGEMRHR
jgi:hypothetical protein